MSSRTTILLIGAVAVAVLIWFLSRQFPGALATDHDQAGLVKALGILLLVGSGLVFAPRLNLKGALKSAVIWGLIAVAILAVYAVRDELGVIAERVGGDLVPSRAMETDEGTITVRRSADGHFRLSAEVDGQPVRFLVDTGASLVTLSAADAARVGIDPASLRFNRRFQTASGEAWGADVRLGAISAGPLRVEDVRASVLDGDGASSLLGMSFLDRLTSFSIEGDTLTLRQ